MKDLVAGLDFRGAMQQAQKGLLLKPILHNYLFDAEFPDFSVEFRNHSMNRPPDGWFHPSEHPLWPERRLYHYLMHPDLMVPEKKEYMGTLSVTIGTAMHGFIEMCLGDAGVRPKALQVCTACPPELGCIEPGVIDKEAGSRGHMDGILDFSSIKVPNEALTQPIFEFKTSNQMKLRSLGDLDLDEYIRKWPDYYAQNQEYMRMSGRRAVVVLFLGMGFPWEMREIHVPYDHAFAMGIRDKYLRVRQQVADQRPSRDCCGKPRSCPAGRVCGIGELLR